MLNLEQLYRDIQLLPEEAQMLVADFIEVLKKRYVKSLPESLIAKMVHKTPGVAGGCACIWNTRIAVWTLISLMNQGADDQELLRDFPGLNLLDLEAARSYYANSKEEIDAEIESNHREDGWDD